MRIRSIFQDSNVFLFIYILVPTSSVLTFTSMLLQLRSTTTRSCAFIQAIGGLACSLRFSPPRTLDPGGYAVAKNGRNVRLLSVASRTLESVHIHFFFLTNHAKKENKITSKLFVFLIYPALPSSHFN